MVSVVTSHSWAIQNAISWWNFTQTSPVCSLGVLRKHYIEHDAYPTGGEWIIKDNISQFEPDICHFRDMQINANSVLHCLLKRKITSVTTIGDSQSRKYFDALLRIFKDSSGICRKTRSEKAKRGRGLVASTKYFSRGNKSLSRALVGGKRPCWTCISQEWLCDVWYMNEEHTFRLENIGMTGAIDRSIQLIDDNAMNSNYNIWFNSFQEFLFKYYFHIQHTDLILLFLPFNHIKKTSSIEFTSHMERLKFLITKYLNSNCKIFILTGTNEFENRKKRGFINTTYEGRLANDQIRTLKHITFDVLKENFKNKLSNIYGFFDLQDMSKSRETWCEDGFHFRTVWYNSVMTNFFQTLCQ